MPPPRPTGEARDEEVEGASGISRETGNAGRKQTGRMEEGNEFCRKETGSAGRKRVLPDAVRHENHKKIPVGVIPTGIFRFS